MTKREFVRTVEKGQDVWRDVSEMTPSTPYYVLNNGKKCLTFGNLFQDMFAWIRGKPKDVVIGGGPVTTTTQKPQTTVPPSTPGPSNLTIPRKRSAYNLSSTVIVVDKAGIQSGKFGSPNADGWYEIKSPRIHSRTPGIPCINVKSDVGIAGYKIKIIDGVFDGLGRPGSGAGALIYGGYASRVWLHNCLFFSTRPQPNTQTVMTNTMRNYAGENIAELVVTNCESYGTGGYYVDKVDLTRYKRIYITQTAGYNTRGTGYFENGDYIWDAVKARLVVNYRDPVTKKQTYIGYSAQFVQVNHLDNVPNVLVDYWVAHNDPANVVGPEAGIVEDFWNVYSSAGTPESPLTFSNYLVENGMPFDPDWTGVEAEHGRAKSIGSQMGYPYSGSGGLNDGYIIDAEKTPIATLNNVPHHVTAKNGTSLNVVNVGFGVTAGNHSKAIGVISYTAGFFRSSHPSGYTRIIPRNGGETINGEVYGNNAVQGMQFYMAGGDKNVFGYHEFDDLAASYNWLDDNGKWQQKSAYIADPNGTTGTSPNKFYNSYTFRQNGIVKAPYNGGIYVHPKPTSVQEAIDTLDRLRAERVATFVAAGKVIGLTDRALGDITNYWNVDV